MHWEGTFCWEDTFWECQRFSGRTDFYSMGRKSEIEKAPRLTIRVPVQWWPRWPCSTWRWDGQPRTGIAVGGSPVLPPWAGVEWASFSSSSSTLSLSLSSHLLPMVETSQLLLFEHLCTFTNGWSVCRRSTRKWKERSWILYATKWETIEIRKLSTICFEKRKTVWGWKVLKYLNITVNNIEMRVVIKSESLI